MTAGSDELLDFLLSGIAICGLGGKWNRHFKSRTCCVFALFGFCVRVHALL